MKGLVFTELLEMVEETYSLEVVDEVLQQVDLPSGGIYTAVGEYDQSEFTLLVEEVSKQINVPVAQINYMLGLRLFDVMAQRHNHFAGPTATAFTFLENLEEYIKTELRKLVPNAILPRFEYTRHPDGRVTLLYHSHRALGDQVHGLIVACFKHFGPEVDIERTDLVTDSGKVFKFVLTPVENVEENVDVDGMLGMTAADS